MLKFEGFEQVDKSITGFKFQQLHLVNCNSAQQMYSDQKGNRISIIQYDSIEEVRIIDTLSKSGVLLNYCGCLQKEKERERKYFIFYHAGLYIDIGTFSQKMLLSSDRVDERFCVQYFQSFVYILTQLQRLGQFIKILSPVSIGLRNPQSQSNTGFGLLLPFGFKFFNCILKEQYEQNIKFIAPQIIRYFIANPNQQVCHKEYRKAGLYSLGLILLSCFGYSFTTKQRIQSSRNDKQFRNIFKKIRKQIKILHTGKFVSKTLKLLLQDCQKSRQIIETFAIKMHSPQFSSLKICKNININDYKFISTISDSNKSEMTEKTRKTINIEINSNTSPLTITPNSNYTQSSKNKNSILQYPDNSPINIEISYEDQTPSQRYRSGLSQNPIQMIQQEMMIKKTPKHEQAPSDQYLKMEEEKIEQKIIKRSQKPQISQQQQVYSYNVNQLKFGDNQSNIKGQKDEKNMASSIFMDQFQLIDHESYDEKSILRRRFQNETKIIMALVLVSFFIYGIIGYIRQNS